MGDWYRVAPVMVPLGQDRRFLYPNFVSQNVADETAVQDFKQSAKTLTGSVQLSFVTHTNLHLSIRGDDASKGLPS